MALFQPAGDILDADMPDDIFLYEPYLPMQGIVLLYGYPSVGKTPLLWAWCEAVQTGGKFWGKRAQQGNALMLSFDMPALMVRNRWMKATPQFRPSFDMFAKTLTVDSTKMLTPYTDKQTKALIEILTNYNEQKRPKLVAIDALREVVLGDLNATGIADANYSPWRQLFPEATVVFNHHESKAKDPYMAGDPQQAATGSMEFINIAQVAMRLYDDKKKGASLSVTKTQASKKPPPKFINLMDDGVHFKGG